MLDELRSAVIVGGIGSDWQSSGPHLPLNNSEDLLGPGQVCWRLQHDWLAIPQENRSFEIHVVGIGCGRSPRNQDETGAAWQSEDG